jgi:hypothetical protein
MTDTFPSMTITVLTWNGEKAFSYQQDTQVSDIVFEAIRDFGYPAGHYRLIRLETRQPLEPDHSLASYGIRDGEALALATSHRGLAQPASKPLGELS